MGGWAPVVVMAAGRETFDFIVRYVAGRHCVNRTVKKRRYAGYMTLAFTLLIFP